MSKNINSFEQYLAALPPDRSGEIERVWQVVRENIPEGYEEEIDSKFLSFKAGQDWYVALANQKNYMSLYLMPVYVFPELKEKLDRSAAGLKCGKSCINFKRADELPLETIGEIVAAKDAQSYARKVRQVRSESKKERSARRRAKP